LRGEHRAGCKAGRRGFFLWGGNAVNWRCQASLAVCALALALVLVGCEGRRASDAKPEEGAMAWSLSSPAFEPHGTIPARHTADGADVSPALSWPAAPEGTVEIALICNDPDAPVGNWVHWVIYGIPPDRTSLPEGVPATETLPDLGGARQGRNDFRRIGYGGPSPPRGPAHHYHFRLYALDAPTNLASGATEPQVMQAMAGHILARADLVGRYGRQ
jgi:Raf kinase inhibitor-like YbhB/YbcL family protein